MYSSTMSMTSSSVLEPAMSILKLAFSSLSNTETFALRMSAYDDGVNISISAVDGRWALMTAFTNSTDSLSESNSSIWKSVILWRNFKFRFASAAKLAIMSSSVATFCASALNLPSITSFSIAISTGENSFASVSFIAE